MRLYHEHLAAGMLPTSIRFLFYELVALKIVEKQASGVLRPGAVGQRRPDQDVIDAIAQRLSRFSTQLVKPPSSRL